MRRTPAMVRDGGGLHEYWNPLTGRRAGPPSAGRPPSSWTSLRKADRGGAVCVLPAAVQPAGRALSIAAATDAAACPRAFVPDRGPL